MFLRIFALTKYFVLSLRRNKSRFIDLFVWPVLELFMFGYLSVYLQGEHNKLSQLAAVVLANLILWHFFCRIMVEIVIQLTDEVFSKNLSNLLLSPLRLWELVVSLFLAAFIKLCLSLLLILPVSWVLYRLSIFSLGGSVTVYFVILVMWGISLGLLVSSLVLMFGSRVGVVSWIIAGVIQPFALVLYPRSVLPGFAQYISYLVPPSFVFEGLRFQLLGGGFQAIEILRALLLVLIYLICSGVFFGIAFRVARRRGTLIAM